MYSIFKDKTIILGVTGSIAAYKAPLLAREFIKSGANVKSILTDAAKEFVTPLTMTNITRNPVITDMFELNSQNEGAWHIDIAHNADVMLIAPCSATTLAKLANGICDNPLISVAIALPRHIPLIISPAMDSTMWLHPSTQRNIEQIKKDGAFIIPPSEGELSSGLIGPGRLPEITDIKNIVLDTLTNWFDLDRYKRNSGKIESTLSNISDDISSDILNAEIDLEELKKKSTYKDERLKGKKVLITAGPTYEKIDDVRYIANHSSGKMGFALAEEAAKFGAEVTLIAGPVSLQTKEEIKRIDVENADAMFEAVKENYKNMDIMILAAAVADYRPKVKFEGKIKKQITGTDMNLELESTEDILKFLGENKISSQKLVGFALESENEIDNGWKKLSEKKCDMIVVNSIHGEQSGFGGDDNTITLLMKNGNSEKFPPMSKKTCAQIILKQVYEI